MGREQILFDKREGATLPTKQLEPHRHSFEFDITGPHLEFPIIAPTNRLGRYYEVEMYGTEIERNNLGRIIFAERHLIYKFSVPISGRQMDALRIAERLGQERKEEFENCEISPENLKLMYRNFG